MPRLTKAAISSAARIALADSLAVRNTEDSRVAEKVRQQLDQMRRDIRMRSRMIHSLRRGHHPVPS